MKNLSLLTSDGKHNIDGSSNRHLIQVIEELKKLKNHASLPLSEINISPIFSQIFPIKDSLLHAITKSMQEKGFDRHQPILLWSKTKEIIDGHTRFKAAETLNINTIPVICVDVPHAQDVEEYIYTLQFNRRNFSVTDRLNFLINYEKRHAKRPKYFRDWIMQKFAVSYGTATKYAALIEHQNSPEFYAVMDSSLTLNKAYESLMGKNTPSQSEKKEDLISSSNTSFLHQLLESFHHLPTQKKKPLSLVPNKLLPL